MKKLSPKKYKMIVSNAIKKIKWLLFLAVAIASSHLTMANEQLKKLKKGEGYLLFSVTTNSQIEHIKIRGKRWLHFELNSLTDQAKYFITNTKAGDYYFADIETGLGEIELDSEIDWAFTVEENTINYIGELNITEFLFSVYSFKELVELENKSSFALEFIQKNHSTILNTLMMKYKGPGEDPFIEFYINQNK